MKAALPYAIAALVAVAAIIQGALAFQRHADSGGYNRCVAEIKTEQTEHLIKSVGGINDAFSKLQILEDDLKDQPDDLASPSMQRTLDGLRKRHPAK